MVRFSFIRCQTPDARRQQEKRPPPLPCSFPVEQVLCSVWASGGIGRRAGFRFLCPQGCGGSSPPSPTNVIHDRPRSRRRRFLWPLILTVVFLAALLLARINQQAGAAVLYLDGIRQSADGLVTASTSLLSLAERIETVDRAEFQTVTDSVLTALDEAAGATEVPPESKNLLGAASLYRMTVATWEDGVQALAEGMIESADQGGAGEERIYAGLQDVAVGDRLYQAVVVELARPEVPDPITEMPKIRFLGTNLSPVALGRLFATAAGAANSLLALRADLGVGQVTADPEWVTDPDGNLVVRAIEQITIMAVVANQGNADAPPQTLVLEIISPDGAESRTVNVPGLAPGAQTTVSIEALAVVPGRTYQLDVSLDLTVADGDPTNNGITLSFFVNEPTG
jgi:hypothetical protein